MARKKSTVLENKKSKIESKKDLNTLDEESNNSIVNEPDSYQRLTENIPVNIDSESHQIIEENIPVNIDSESHQIIEENIPINNESESHQTTEENIPINIDSESYQTTEENIPVNNESESYQTTEENIPVNIDLDSEIKLENIYINNENIINIKKIETNKNLDILLNETYIQSLIKSNKLVNNDNTSNKNYVNYLNNKEYILNEEQLKNILTDKLTENILNNYTLDDLKKIFNQVNEAIILVEILNRDIKFIEKKGYESRNQSVIDLLMQTNKYNKLPDVQFLVFTNDYINNSNIIDKSYLFTFCKKYNYKTSLFPNFSFNHWMESKIPSYEYIYDSFTNSNVSWIDKEDSIFWTGSNTNIIRKKIYESSKLYPNFNINLLDKNKSNFIPINETLKYKYLLNMNGYSFGGRLNYLLLTKSCVIILKNNNKEEDYEEYFYKFFIPNEDYIEIKYNNNENGEIIINRIITEIHKHDCEKIAERCFEKAKLIFKMNNVYDHIHNSLTDLSKKNSITNQLNNRTCYVPPLNYFFKNRLNNNDISFNFIGKDFELNLIDNETSNKINIKIINDNTKIKLNKIIIYDKYTPYIINEKKSQYFQILIDNNQLVITINQKFNIIKIDLPDQKINITENEILSEFGGWLIV